MPSARLTRRRRPQRRDKDVLEALGALGHAWVEVIEDVEPTCERVIERLLVARPHCLKAATKTVRRLGHEEDDRRPDVLALCLEVVFGDRVERRVPRAEEVGDVGPEGRELRLEQLQRVRRLGDRRRDRRRVRGEE